MFGCWNMNWYEAWGLGTEEDEVKREIFEKIADVNRLMHAKF